ncbi:MAG: DciA family protein [Planctomycetota bacterium]
MHSDRRSARDRRVPAASRLETLSQRRSVRSRAVPIGAMLEGFRTQLARRERTVGPIQSAWAKVVPEELAAASTVIGLRGGTLTVRISDSSARFATDRFLRAGGELRLIRACPATVRRVRLIP